MIDLGIYLRVALLIPVGFVGAMTGMAISGAFAPKSLGEVALLVLVFCSLHLPLVGVLYWIWNRSGFFWGLSSTTWLFLLLVAYFVGFVPALVSA
jgi:hypothetical protein